MIQAYVSPVAPLLSKSGAVSELEAALLQNNQYRDVVPRSKGVPGIAVHPDTVTVSSWSRTHPRRRNMSLG